MQRSESNPEMVCVDISSTVSSYFKQSVVPHIHLAPPFRVYRKFYIPETDSPIYNLKYNQKDIQQTSKLQEAKSAIGRISFYKIISRQAEGWPLLRR